MGPFNRSRGTGSATESSNGLPASEFTADDSSSAAAERDAEETFASALHESDSAAEVIHDSAVDSNRRWVRRALFPLAAFAAVAGAVGLRRRQLRKRRESRWGRVSGAARWLGNRLPGRGD